MRAFDALASVAATLGIVIASIGCSDARDTERASDPTTGTIPITSAKLDAIGSIRIAGAERSGTCTGTLIAPSVVLTAEHCVLGVRADELTFTIGAYTATPKRSVAVMAIATENLMHGGALHLGSDVAVLHLSEAIADVRPLAYAPFASSTRGKPYLAAGYGSARFSSSAVRRASSLALRGTRGPYFQLLYGSFANFLRYAPHFLDLDPDPSSLRAIYDGARLLEGYEVAFASRSSYTGTCDAGGPILQTTTAGWVVYGVTSPGYEASGRRCAFGGIDAALGPVSIDFIDRQLGCPMLPAGGSCQGDVRVSCRASDDGWTEERLDCAASGQSCVLGWDGTAACVDTCADAPPRCDADVLVTCRSDAGRRIDERVDCAAKGQVCASDPQGAARCMDPCEGIPRQGVCFGDVAFRCTYPNEGPRRLVAADCAQLEQACGIDVITGEVGCVDPPL
jgi:hypothetical protein